MTATSGIGCVSCLGTGPLLSNFRAQVEHCLHDGVRGRPIAELLVPDEDDKDTLAMQVKLNELLAAVNKASPQLINLEDRSESEVREIHDLYQVLQSNGSECCSIDEVRDKVEDTVVKMQADLPRINGHAETGGIGFVSS